jgi:hypothetical protein
MKVVLAIILWFILLTLCWPLAIILFFLFPIVWLLTLPFQIIGFTLDLVFKVIRGIVLFPFKVVKAI